MNGLSALLGGADNLDTYLLLILIFILLRSGDESGTVFALGYLLFADEGSAPLGFIPSARRYPREEVSKRPPPGDCRR